MRVLLALAALCQRGSLLPLSHGSTATQLDTGEENLNIGNKSVEFVNIIKEDLRRNNDDYELLEGENQLEHSEPPARPAQHEPPARPAQHVHPARRGGATHPAYPAIPGRPTPQQPHLQPAHPAPAHVAPPTHVGPPARAAPLRRSDRQKGGSAKLNQYVAVQTDEFKSYTRSKLYKSQRHSELKQLLHKDQVKMRQQDQPQAEDLIQAEEPPLADDQQQAEDQQQTEDQTLTEDQLQAEGQAEPEEQTEEEDATVDSPPPRTSPEDRTHAPPHSSPRAPPHSSPRPSVPPLDDREQSPVLRNRKEYSPPPEHLDMAAARNPELTRIRMKGRLCQRSLMNAEGPKYDKLGHVLQPAHRPRKARGRQFHQTRAPALLLPRCCNCCKKSVLGCQ